MTLEWMKYIALALGIALGLSSCGNTTTAEGGIGGSGMSMGSVTAVGSIWVNGVEYDTTGALIVKTDDGTQVLDLDGTAGGTSVLPGMVVTVEGSINADRITGTATRVTYSDSLQGSISAIPSANSLEVLGQTVIIDNLTKDQTNSLWNDTSAFTVGESVKVSGFVDAQGNLRATYIEKTSDSALEIKGVVDAVLSPYRFTIGALTVDTTGIGMDVSALAGQFVEVKGSIYVGGVLTASSVEARGSMLDSGSYDEAELEGIVTSVPLAGSEFYLDSQRVVVDASAEFNGGLAADIVPGVKLEVEGSIANGVFTAMQIHFQDSIELEGDVATIGAGTLTLVGLPGVSVSVDDVVTELEGDDLLSADIQVGHHLKVRGRDTSTGSGTSVLATRIESAASGSPDVVLQGPLQSKTPPFVQVLGISVDTTGMSYEMDSAASSVDANTFFSTVQLDDLVSLNGTWNGSGVSWNAIELDQ